MAASRNVLTQSPPPQFEQTLPGFIDADSILPNFFSSFVPVKQRADEIADRTDNYQ